MKIEWGTIQNEWYRSWTARQILTRDMWGACGMFAVRRTDDGHWWVTIGLDDRAEKYAGPFKTIEDARTAAEMIIYMGVKT